MDVLVHCKVRRNKVHLRLSWCPQSTECCVCYTDKPPYTVVRFHKNCVICKPCIERLRVHMPYMEHCFCCHRPLTAQEMLVLSGGRTLERKECPHCDTRVVKNLESELTYCPTCTCSFSWSTGRIYGFYAESISSVLLDEVR